MTIYKYKMDFEVGTLMKSPCRECEERENFPNCIDQCRLLDHIQTLLAETRSFTRGAS